MEQMTIETCKHIVYVLYEILLEREPDASGLEFWSKHLHAGTLTDYDVAYEIMKSKEYKSKYKRKVVNVK